MKNKKQELNINQLFEIALNRIDYPRYQWDGGDQSVYVSNQEIICRAEFWQRLTKTYKFHIDHKLGKENEKNPHWLKFATIYFQLVITNGNTKKFWHDFLKPTPREIKKVSI